jgi:hypothetical protein
MAENLAPGHETPAASLETTPLRESVTLEVSLMTMRNLLLFHLGLLPRSPLELGPQNLLPIEFHFQEVIILHPLLLAPLPSTPPCSLLQAIPPSLTTGVNERSNGCGGFILLIR